MEKYFESEEIMTAVDTIDLSSPRLMSGFQHLSSVGRMFHRLYGEVMGRRPESWGYIILTFFLHEKIIRVRN